METQDIIEALTEQRNAALNAYALAQAEVKSLQRKLAELEKANEQVSAAS